MDTKLDIKKQVEALLGHEITEEVLQTYIFTQAVASSTISDGSTTTKNLLVLRPNHCRQARFLDVGGFWTTGSEGKALFRLTEFLCHTGESFQQPLNVVATPISSTPCYVTIVAKLINNGADAQIEVWSWDADGAAAPDVYFNWRCRLEFAQFIL